ncbi:MAG: site-2 protease family protein [bacterium]|nr:site-2 protease family protein [bacterium]
MVFQSLDNPSLLVANLLVLLVAMTIHEFAHNYVGWRMGDPTPAQTGRLTLNPFVHINWVGWLMFALIGFGILGSAPISPWRMPSENRRWRWLAAVAAGPVSNLLLAILFGLIVRVVGFGTFASLPDVIFYIFTQMVTLNVLLFVFNLLPLFPIDGWQIVYALLPPDLASWWERNRQTTQYIFFGLLLLSFFPLPGIPNLFGIIIGQPVNFLVGLILGV